MPLYEFRCPNGKITERFVKLGTEKITCPKCQQVAKKIMSICTFKLKGCGWYADGYSSKNKKD